MWREDRFIAFSQNFIADPNLVKRLIKQSCISISDIVIDIGAGKGAITKLLSKSCKEVVAIELDRKLYTCLAHDLYEKNITLIHNDILKVGLPRSNYKVFSNIPFNYTSRIMNKLYFRNNPPKCAYLIMQREAAKLYAGLSRETQKSLLLKPFFSIETFHKFRKNDFRPVPSVDINMVKIEKLENPLVDKKDRPEYFDFVVYGTTRYKRNLKKSLSKIFTHEQFKRLSKKLAFDLEAKPLDLKHTQWVALYYYYKDGVESKKKLIVNGAYTRQRILQNRLKKVYRTICDL